MDEKPEPSRQLPAPVSQSRVTTIVKVVSSWDTKKRVIAAAVIAVLFIVLHKLIIALVWWAVTTAVLGGIAIVALTVFRLKQDSHLKNLEDMSRAQTEFLNGANSTHRLAPSDVIKTAQQYMLEKTWGLSGLRWRINNIDIDAGRIAADFECGEGTSGEIVKPGTAAATPKSFGIFPAVLPSTKSTNKRYVSVNLVASASDSAGCSLEYTWDFRYPEQTISGRPPAIPPVLFDVCKDLVKSINAT